MIGASPREQTVQFAVKDFYDLGQTFTDTDEERRSLYDYVLAQTGIKMSYDDVLTAVRANKP